MSKALNLMSGSWTTGGATGIFPSSILTTDDISGRSVGDGFVHKIARFSILSASSFENLILTKEERKGYLVYMGHTFPGGQLKVTRLKPNVCGEATDLLHSFSASSNLATSEYGEIRSPDPPLHHFLDRRSSVSRDQENNQQPDDLEKMSDRDQENDQQPEYLTIVTDSRPGERPAIGSTISLSPIRTIRPHASLTPSLRPARQQPVSLLSKATNPRLSILCLDVFDFGCEIDFNCLGISKADVCVCWICYMCLTAHFIDEHWTLHKRIINFCPIVGHSGVLIGRAIEKCLVEWGLKNIMTITVDNASSNDVAVNHLRNVLNHWECGVLKGAFLHMRCAAHILNLVVKDGLMDVNLSVKKIRTLVKYVRSSPARLLKFKSSIEEEKIESKSLVCMDVDTRWNSTFFMLESAVKFKKAFSNLLLKDSNFAKEVKKCEGGVITNEDWVNVNSLLPFLKIFLDATKRFSGSRYVTSNAYVHEIFGIGKVIDGFTMHVDKSIKNMTLKMQTKYKNEPNQFMFLGVVLDPRRKWQYIVWVVQKIFGEIGATCFLANLESNIHVLFDSYSSSLPQNETEEEVSSSTPSDSHNSTLGDEVEMDIEQLMTKHFEMDMGSCEGNLKKTELDKYLGEDREAMDVNFDILKWWGINKCRYPVLSKMARDVLAIPVSSVASESAFSTGGRVLDSFRTSLTPRMVEALVCTQDWVRDCHDPINKLEEEGLKDLTVDQPTIIIDETVDELADNIRVGVEVVNLNFRICMLLSESESEISDIRKFGYPKFRIRIRIVIFSFRKFRISGFRISEFSDIRISDIRIFEYPHMNSPTDIHSSHIYIDLTFYV
ncbi:hypothetical protein LXL04_039857 [Taraxacum kok-saghyz]